MIFVYLRNRERIPVPGAASVRQRGEIIVCLGESGEELRRFSADEVWAYTREDLGEIDDEFEAENRAAFGSISQTDAAISEVRREHHSNAP